MSHSTPFPPDPSRGPYCVLRTGRRFYFLDPKPEDIADTLLERVIFLADNLSMINRWTGNTRKPITDAQHSVLVSLLAPKGKRGKALFHDGSEAITNDFPRPLKYMPGMDYLRDKVEDPIQIMIYEMVGTDSNLEDAEVKLADDIATGIEARDLMPPMTEWECYTKLIGPQHTYNVLEPWSQELSRVCFLARYKQLLNECEFSSTPTPTTCTVT